MLFAHSLVLNVQKPHSKRCKNQGAMAPLAVFVFGSNSCEIDVHQTLIRAKLGQPPKQMSKSFLSVSPSVCYYFSCPQQWQQWISGFQFKGAQEEQRVTF